MFYETIDNDDYDETYILLSLLCFMTIFVIIFLMYFIIWDFLKPFLTRPGHFTYPCVRNGVILYRHAIG